MAESTGNAGTEKQYDQSLIELAMCKISKEMAEVKLDEPSKWIIVSSSDHPLNNVKSSHSQSRNTTVLPFPFGATPISLATNP